MRKINAKRLQIERQLLEGNVKSFNLEQTIIKHSKETFEKKIKKKKQSEPNQIKEGVDGLYGF